MHHAFAITNEDIATVFSNEFNMRLDPDSDQANRVFDRLDHGAIEKAALDADIGSAQDEDTILDIQTAAAYDEIARQVRAFKKR